MFAKCVWARLSIYVYSGDCLVYFSFLLCEKAGWFLTVNTWAMIYYYHISALFQFHISPAFISFLALSFLIKKSQRFNVCVRAHLCNYIYARVVRIAGLVSSQCLFVCLPAGLCVFCFFLFVHLLYTLTRSLSTRIRLRCYAVVWDVMVVMVRTKQMLICDICWFFSDYVRWISCSFNKSHPDRINVSNAFRQMTFAHSETRNMEKLCRSYFA